MMPSHLRAEFAHGLALIDEGTGGRQGRAVIGVDPDTLEGRDHEILAQTQAPTAQPDGRGDPARGQCLFAVSDDRAKHPIGAT